MMYPVRFIRTAVDCCHHPQQRHQKSQHWVEPVEQVEPVGRQEQQVEQQEPLQQ